MKRAVKIIKLIFILLVPPFLVAFASSRNDKRTVKDVRINYKGNENVYITDHEIRNLLLQNQKPDSIAKNSLDIYTLEDRLDAHQMIEDTEVFVTLDGILEVDVKQRKPIARIYDKGSFYYMDNQGERMPLSKVYSARVPIVSGVISEENWKDTYQLIKEIKADDFMVKNITEIIIFDKNKYSVRLRIPNFKVVLGKINNLDIKFDNLKAFYKKAEKDDLMNTYKQIDLQYDNQVVCTRK